MDAALSGWINGLAGVPFWDRLMMGLSTYGITLMVALVALQWWVKDDRRHTRHVVLVAGLAFLLGLLLNQGVLMVVQRMRPYDEGITHLLIARSGDWSFPSDHATAAVAMAAAFMEKTLRRRGLVLLALAGLIGFSRVYLGIHYAGDVLGGAVTGAVAAVMAGWTYREGSPFDKRATRFL